LVTEHDIQQDPTPLWGRVLQGKILDLSDSDLNLSRSDMPRGVCSRAYSRDVDVDNR
jgi:hypothetical protein